MYKEKIQNEDSRHVNAESIFSAERVQKVCTSSAVNHRRIAAKTSATIGKTHLLFVVTCRVGFTATDIASSAHRACIIQRLTEVVTWALLLSDDSNKSRRRRRRHRQSYPGLSPPSSHRIQQTSSTHSQRCILAQLLSHSQVLAEENGGDFTGMVGKWHLMSETDNGHNLMSETRTEVRGEESPSMPQIRRCLNGSV